MKRFSKKEKQVIVDYLIENCGYKKWQAIDGVNGRVQPRGKLMIGGGRGTSIEKRDSIIFFLSKKGFTSRWIAECLNLDADHVSHIITRMKNERKI